MQLPAPIEEPTRVRARSAGAVAFLEDARSGVIARLKAHGDARALVGVADAAGWTALHYCAARDHVGALAFLLDAGAPPDAASALGHTALAVAARR